jgi:hypothetical protein
MEVIWDVDSIIGIAAAFNRLIVFGKRNIVVFADSVGSTVGLDPANLFVEDIISGTGLVDRDTIQNIGEGDLWYLSPNGVQSLIRVIQEKNNPLTTVTGTIRDYLSGLVSGNSGFIRSTYNQEKGFYLLVFAGSGRQVCVNTKGAMEDGSYRCTEWALPRVHSAVTRASGDTVFGLTLGEIAQYGGASDFGSNFTTEYQSGWLALGDDFEAFTKILKKWTSTLYVEGAGSLTFKLYKDFETAPCWTKSITLTGDGGDEWNVAEFGIGEFSGGLALRELNFNVAKTAQYIRLGVEGEVTYPLAYQKFNVIAKRGRFNT